MAKDRMKMCNWEENDVFALPINSDKYPNYNGRYFIFIHKTNIGREYQKSRTQKLFYVKITENKVIPNTKEEIDKLEYVKIESQNFNVVRTWNFDGAKNLAPDKYNLVYVYLTKIWAIKYKLPEDLRYIGNFNIVPPKNEYIPKSIFSLTLNCWKDYFNKLIQDNLIETYKRNNLCEGFLFSKEYQDNIEANEQYRIMGINKLRETLKRLEEDPMGTLKEMGIDIEKELENPKNNHETYVGGDNKNAMNKKS